MELGQQISSATELDLPAIIFFVSTFCSKCLYNRKILQKYINPGDLYEIPITESHPILEEVRPRSAPTLVVVDTTGRVLAYEEGVISDKTAVLLRKLLNNE